MKHKKIIVWGAKYDTGHTHAFTHAAFFEAAKYLKYDAYWLDNRDNVDESFFDNALIISEHWLIYNNPLGNRLPLRNSSTYVINYLGNKHRSHIDHYLNKVGRLIDLRFACSWEDANWSYKFEKDKYTSINHGHSFFEKGSEYDNVYSWWATDLLPNQIHLKDANIQPKEPKFVFFSGTVREDNKDIFDPFIRACSENSMQFVYNTPWQTQLPISELKRVSNEAYIVFESRSKFHVDNGYIPCRSFKNISYGQLGLTNSKAVYDYFDQEIAYSPDTYELFYVAKEMKSGERSVQTVKSVIRLMQEIREKHTFVNRLNDLIAATEM